MSRRAVLVMRMESLDDYMQAVAAIWSSSRSYGQRNCVACICTVVPRARVHRRSAGKARNPYQNILAGTLLLLVPLGRHECCA